MQRGHGDADKLIVGDFNRGQFDQIVAVAVEDDEAAGVARTILSNNFVGPERFGRMFPGPDPFRPPDEALRDLGRAMREIAPNDPALDNSDIPSGFTYLGQFVDHDITRDPTQDFPVIDAPEEIPQARNPNLDLDSLYGLGPRRQRELYDQTLPFKDRERRAVFKIGLTSSQPSPGGGTPGTPTVPVSMPHDLPRKNQTVVIGDPRNDDVLVVPRIAWPSSSSTTRSCSSPKTPTTSAKTPSSHGRRRGTGIPHSIRSANASGGTTNGWCSTISSPGSWTQASWRK